MNRRDKTSARLKPGQAGRRRPQLLLLLLPAALSILVFAIYPAVRYIAAAFFHWTPPQSILDSRFVGLKWFSEIVHYYGLPRLIRNSLILGIWDVCLMALPLILALASRHCGSPRLKKALDVFALIAMFIPSIVVVAITQKILSTEGLLNQILALFGVPAENHLLKGEWFYAIFSLSGCWSSIGAPLLVYKACLSGSNRELHAAAQLDGAGLLTRIIRIDLPLCRSTFLTNLCMQIAGILATNTERLMLFKNTANSEFASTIDLFAYELTFKSSIMPSYSKAIALSMMTTAVNLVLLAIARKVSARRENIYDT